MAGLVTSFVDRSCGRLDGPDKVTKVHQERSAQRWGLPPNARVGRTISAPVIGRVISLAEDSPSGLWRSLGKRVGLIALRGSNPLSSAIRCRSRPVRPPTHCPKRVGSAFVLSAAADPARDWLIGMSTKLRVEATLGHDGVGVGGIARV